jgi:hypothetical protein
MPTQDRILLSEWAGDTNVPRLLGMGSDRSACPVCGHPTGDCTHDHYVEVRKIMAETQKKGAGLGADQDNLQTSQAPEVAAPEGDDVVVIKSDGKVEDSLFAKVEAGDELVTLAKDVVEEFYYPGTKRASYRLLYTKGQVVRRSDVERTNARADGSVVSEENPAGIDSTTLVSHGANSPAKADEAPAEAEAPAGKAAKK